MNLKRQAEIKVMLCSCDDCKDEDIYFKELQQLGKNLEYRKNFKQIFTTRNICAFNDYSRNTSLY